MGFILEIKGWSDIKIYQTIHHINRTKKNTFTHICTNCTEEPIQCIKARTWIKRHNNWYKQFLLPDNMTVYQENPKQSTKQLLGLTVVLKRTTK